MTNPNGPKPQVQKLDRAYNKMAIDADDRMWTATFAHPRMVAMGEELTLNVSVWDPSTRKYVVVTTPVDLSRAQELKSKLEADIQHWETEHGQD